MKPALPPGTRPATRTFGVLAGAYAAKNPKSLLTHAAEVNERNYPIRVLCRRVDVDHLCPDWPAMGGTTDAPTCPVCLKRMNK